jgi:hypothetical protein
MATNTTANFITSLDLGNNVVLDGPAKGKPVNHFVYGSSLYGTMFGVFCQINGQDGNNSFKIDSLLLKIINYSGVLNIGFWTGGTVARNNRFDIQRGVIHFAVQGANIIDELSIPTPSLEVREKEPVTLIFKRTLHPLDGFLSFNDGNQDPTRQSTEIIPKKPVFDTEFNHRNGVDLYFNQLRPGMFGFREPDETPLPSPRCHEGFVRLVYPCKQT